MSNFPDHTDPTTKLLERIELKKVYREKIIIETEPDLWIPFYLFIPKNAPDKCPVIFVLHGHGAGKIETGGLVSSYQKSNALALAEEGFVTVAPDFRGFGETGWSGEWVDALGHDYGRSIHVQDVLNNFQLGRTVLGSFLYDLQIILSYVQKRQEVASGKIGVAGTSMGADIALWFAAIETSISAVVAEYPGTLSFPYEPGDYGSFHPCIHSIPGIRRLFRPEEIPLLIFPRPLLIDFNENKHAIGNRDNIEILYKKAGCPEKASIRLHKRGDTFHVSKAVEWFKKWL